MSRPNARAPPKPNVIYFICTRHFHAKRHLFHLRASRLKMCDSDPIRSHLRWNKFTKSPRNIARKVEYRMHDALAIISQGLADQAWTLRINQENLPQVLNNCRFCSHQHDIRSGRVIIIALESKYGNFATVFDYRREEGRLKQLLVRFAAKAIVALLPGLLGTHEPKKSKFEATS